MTKPKTWDFESAFQTLTGNPPFPWQTEIYRQFEQGICQRDELLRCDIPTGLGKTSIIAVWLLARSQGAPLPRRLVYIVDRRAVVDQATSEAMNLRSWVDGSLEVKKSLGLASDQTLFPHISR